MMNSKFNLKLLKLLNLSSRRKHDEIKNLLEPKFYAQHNPSMSKGLLAQHFIAELIIGNNKWAFVTSTKGNNGVDIIEYSRTGYVPCKCYQIRNKTEPLSKHAITTEINKFKVSEYNQLPYYILSISGFTFDKNDLSDYNIYLLDYENVITLINNYSKNFNTNPGSTYFLKDDDFMSNFNQLLNSKQKFGKCNFYDHLPAELSQWCTKIRKQKTDGTLNIKKILLMNSINFYWRHIDYLWDKTFNEMLKIHTKYGTTYGNVIFPQHKSWIKKQLNDYLNGQLSPTKLKQLQSINLINEWLLNR